MKDNILQKGFTLVEALVAIAILLFAIVAPMTMASLGLHSAQFAKDQIIASYLAQEGVEYIRNARDTNVLGGASWLTTILSTCNGTDGCIVDGFKSPTLDGLTACSGACGPLLFNTSSSEYQYTSGDISPYTRSVRVTEDEDNPDEASVAVTVSWSGGTLLRSVVATTTLFNWQSI